MVCANYGIEVLEEDEFVRGALEITESISS